MVETVFAPHTSTNKSQTRRADCIAALIPNELRMIVTSAVTSLGAIVSYDELDYEEAVTLLLEVSATNVKRHANLAKFVSEKTSGSTIGLASWDALRTGQLDVMDGIDDLILYPIETSDLKYRLKRHIHFLAPDVSDNGGVMHFGDLAFNLQLSKLLINTKTIAFTGKEFALLLYLARQNERPVSHVELACEALKIPKNYPTLANTVNVHIARVRAKLREHSLEMMLGTLRNEGFFLHHKLR
jgi:DNA-binding winged helix-turn-helix (wHTH) protein